MKFSKELQSLLEEVADICDGGHYLDLDKGADTRYDGSTYGEGLLHAYQKFLLTKEGERWYEDAVAENHKTVLGSGE